MAVGNRIHVRGEHENVVVDLERPGKGKTCAVVVARDVDHAGPAHVAWYEMGLARVRWSEAALCGCCVAVLERSYFAERSRRV